MPTAPPPSGGDDELVLTAESRSLRRALGPTAWVVLEELTTCGTLDPADGTVVAATTLRDLADALGLGRDAVASALKALALAGWVRSETARGAGGRFGAGRYLVSTSPALRRVAALATPRPARSGTTATTRQSRDLQLSLLDLSVPARVPRVRPTSKATTTP